MAFTGLAKIGNETTDKWVARIIRSFAKPDMDFDFFLEKLMQHLTLNFRHSAIPKAYRRLTLGIAGFQPAGGIAGYQTYDTFYGPISNEEDNGDVTDEFYDQVKLRGKNTDSKKTLVMVNGYLPAVKNYLDHRINEIRRRLCYRTGEDIVHQLVTLVRVAAADSNYGKYIGRNCVSVVLPRDGIARTEYHTDLGSTFTVTPVSIDCTHHR